MAEWLNLVLVMNTGQVMCVNPHLAKQALLGGGLEAWTTSSEALCCWGCRCSRKILPKRTCGVSSNPEMMSTRAFQRGQSSHEHGSGCSRCIAPMPVVVHKVWGEVRLQVVLMLLVQVPQL